MSKRKGRLHHVVPVGRWIEIRHGKAKTRIRALLRKGQIAYEFCGDGAVKIPKQTKRS